jgi:entry exclusion lipoprotein TrbK
MRKELLILAVGVAMVLSSCGDKFVPLTQDQINAKVDSIYNAEKDAKLQELRTACQSGLDAQVSAKVEALKTEANAAK